MTKADLLAPVSAVEAAIARVLDAEHAGRESVAAARAVAATLTEDARAGARAIAERTERRIRSVRAAFEERTSAEVRALEAEAAATGAARELTDDEIARVNAAVSLVAARLVDGAER